MVQAKLQQGPEIPFISELLKLLGVNGLDPSMMMNPIGMAASPGANLLGKMFKEKKVGSTVSDLIDDLITLKAKSAPSPPKARVLDPKNANDQLEILLRR